jgi:hypothetical protein
MLLNVYKLHREIKSLYIDIGFLEIVEQYIFLAQIELIYPKVHEVIMKNYYYIQYELFFLSMYILLAASSRLVSGV